MSKINKFKWTYQLFGYNYRVAALSTLDQTVLGIIIQSLKLIVNGSCKKHNIVYVLSISPSK